MGDPEVSFQHSDGGDPASTSFRESDGKVGDTGRPTSYFPGQVEVISDMTRQVGVHLWLSASAALRPIGCLRSFRS